MPIRCCRLFTVKSIHLLNAVIKMLWLVLVRRLGTRAFYDAYSHEYDTLVRDQPEAADARQFLDEYLASHGIRITSVLEAGCGTGQFSRRLVGLASDLHGVDFSQAQLERAREKGLPMTFTQGDVLALPYPDDRFDLVTSFELLAHLPSEEAAYCREAYRVLKPGGVLVLDAVKRPPKFSLPARMACNLRSLARIALVKLTNIDSWTNPPSDEYLLDALLEAGFESELFTRTYGTSWRFFVGRKPALSNASSLD